MCPICHFPSPNLPLPCYAFFLNWLNFTFPIPMLHVQKFIVYLRRYIFKLSNEFSQSIFRLCNTPGPRQAACKAQAQHSQGCNVFYKIVNCHLCWKAFPPRHLHFGRCCTLESWLTSSRNSCRSEVADILHKIQTAQWPEPCREPAMQGNGCWEGAKKTEICLNNMLVTNREGTLCVPNPSHLIRFSQTQCCTVHGQYSIQFNSCKEDIVQQSKVFS